VQLRVDKGPSTNEAETRVRHRHAELTTILPNSCAFTGHRSMNLIQFSDGVPKLEIRQNGLALSGSGLTWNGVSKSHGMTP